MYLLRGFKQWIGKSIFNSFKWVQSTLVKKSVVSSLHFHRRTLFQTLKISQTSNVSTFYHMFRFRCKRMYFFRTIRYYLLFVTVCYSLFEFSRHPFKMHFWSTWSQTSLICIFRMDEINLEIKSGTRENIKLASNHFKSISCMFKVHDSWLRFAYQKDANKVFFGNFCKHERHVLLKYTVEISVPNEHQVVWLMLGDSSVF